jgi:hypothetical protein
MALLLSEDSLDPAIMESEITWWIETGIDEYIKLYDLAIQAVFKGRLADIERPAQYNFERSMVVPRHLFGDLRRKQRTEADGGLACHGIGRGNGHSEAACDLLCIGTFPSHIAIVEKLLPVEWRFQLHLLRDTLTAARCSEVRLGDLSVRD